MVLNVVAYLICTVSGLILIKLGSKGTSLVLNNSYIDMKINLLIVLGLFFYMTSFLLWIRILKNNDLSYIVALTTGLSYVLIMICSIAFLNEKVTMVKGIGVVIILIGVIVINLNK